MYTLIMEAGGMAIVSLQGIMDLAITIAGMWGYVSVLRLTGTNTTAASMLWIIMVATEEMMYTTMAVAVEDGTVTIADNRMVAAAGTEVIITIWIMVVGMVEVAEVTVVAGKPKLVGMVQPPVLRRLFYLVYILP
jgi:hypothetical protein